MDTREWMLQRWVGHQVVLNGREEKERDMKGRWKTESISVPWARNTVSGARWGTALPLAAASAEIEIKTKTEEKRGLGQHSDGLPFRA